MQYNFYYFGEKQRRNLYGALYKCNSVTLTYTLEMTSYEHKHNIVKLTLIMDTYFLLYVEKFHNIIVIKLPHSITSVSIWAEFMLHACKCWEHNILLIYSGCISLLLPRLPKLTRKFYSNGPDNLVNLGSH